MEHEAQRQRVRWVCRDMYRAIADRPEADQALAVNELVETYLTRGVRLRLRDHTFVERERYVGVRAAVYHLREKYWTPENWLELRLTKYIAMGVFTVGHKLFSMLQSDDGLWQRQILVPAPSNLNRARQDFIYGPLPVPSPFREPRAVITAQRELLKGHDIDISDDGGCASIDPFAAGSSAVMKARKNNNYIEPNELHRRRPRLQILCDAVGYFRGKRQATRFGIRTPDMKRKHNSKYYFSNVALFLGSDHYEELLRYLSTIYDALNAGLRTEPTGKDEVGNDSFSSTVLTDKVACLDCDVEIVDGGDAACANASAGLEPPPSKHGCCFYCEGRRKEWFDVSKCNAHVRRTLFRSALMAHRLPPGAPPGARYKCPAEGCKHVCTSSPPSPRPMTQTSSRSTPRRSSRSATSSTATSTGGNGGASSSCFTWTTSNGHLLFSISF